MESSGFYSKSVKILNFLKAQDFPKSSVFFLPLPNPGGVASCRGSFVIGVAGAPVGLLAGYRARRRIKAAAFVAKMSLSARARESTYAWRKISWLRRSRGPCTEKLPQRGNARLGIRGYAARRVREVSLQHPTRRLRNIRGAMGLRRLLDMARIPLIVRVDELSWLAATRRPLR